MRLRRSRGWRGGGEGFALGCGRGGEVDLPQQCGQDGGEEFVHAFCVAVDAALALARDADFDALAQDGLVLGDHADVCCAFAEDDSPELCAALGLRRLLQHLERHAVPSVGLFDRELAVELEVERVVLPQLDMFVLGRDLPRDVQLARPDVEVCAGDGDGEVEGYALRGYGAGI